MSTATEAPPAPAKSRALLANLEEFVTLTGPYFMLTEEQARDRLGVTQETVYRWKRRLAGCPEWQEQVLAVYDDDGERIA